MFGLTKLWAALATLTTNVTALAETVAVINTGLRQHVGLDGHDPLALPALPPPAPAEALGDADDSDDGAPAKPRRRGKAA